MYPSYPPTHNQLLKPRKWAALKTYQTNEKHLKNCCFRCAFLVGFFENGFVDVHVLGGASWRAQGSKLNCSGQHCLIWGFHLFSFLFHLNKLKTSSLTFSSFALPLTRSISVSTIYILGVIWLGTLIGWDKPVLELGVSPFLLAEIFKITLLTILTKKILKLRKLI